MSIWPGYYSGLANAPATGRMYARLNTIKSVARLPSDPIGYVTIGFSGIPEDTEVRAFKTSDGTEIDGIENFVTGTTFSCAFYGEGQSGARWVFIHPEYEYLSFELEIPRNDTTLPVVMRKSRIEEQRA